MLFHGKSELGGQLQGSIRIGVLGPDQQDFTPPSEKTWSLRRTVASTRHKILQHLIGSKMAKRITDGPEVIEAKQQHGRFGASSTRGTRAQAVCCSIVDCNAERFSKPVRGSRRPMSPQIFLLLLLG
jgi:hypothetical protein